MTVPTKFIYRGQEDYERARVGGMWNRRVPPRYPAVIVQANGVDDVVTAIGKAKALGLRVSVRSGGHSWAATFLRDDCLLIDLSAMNAVGLNVEARTARIQPGLRGTDLNRALRQHDLFFPSGHCMTVGLGGFLLQGGFGWNSRLWGPACVSVTGIELVTAAGEIVRADATENPDLYWAARGAGPGFFGVVTAFDVKLQTRPNVMMRSDYHFPADVMDDVFAWARDVQPSLARTMECMIFVRRDMFGHAGPGGLLTGPVIADSREEALDALGRLDTCPAIAKATFKDVNADTEFDDLMQGGQDLLYPPGRRYAADNMWTSAPASALIPAMREIAGSLPAAPSHMMWMLWGPAQPLPDMAFSMQDDLYIALYSVWDDPAQDTQHQAWVTDHMRRLEPLSSGIQLADENLGDRRFRFMAEGNLRKLETIRAARDPEGLFHSYMGAQ